MTVPKDQISYVPYGERESITLSLSIVRKQFCFPTKSGVQPSDRDVLFFLMHCRSNALNPFTGDTWLTGYDSRDGAKFSPLTSQRVLLRRAEGSPNYDGIESGIIVEREDGTTEELQTELIPRGATLIGGWAKVYRRDRSRPDVKRLPLASYRKPSPFWDNNPAGMIVKCAESDALRFAFPSVNGGLYTQEEMPVVDIGSIANQVQMVASEPAGQSPEQPALTLSPAPKAPHQGTVQEELADVVVGAGLTFDQFSAWAVEVGTLKDGQAASFAEVPKDVCVRLLRVRPAMIEGINKFQGGAA